MANRLYYSYYQFFLWYFWKSRTLTPLETYDKDLETKVLRAKKGSTHKGLTKTVKQKVPSLLASAGLNVTETDLGKWSQILYKYRKHADYHLELEFGDEEFEGLLKYYRKLRLVMEALSARSNR